MGRGNDTIHGGEGYDKIVGGEGFNIIYGGAGNDIIDAGTGPTEVYSGDGNDLITWAYAPLSSSGPTVCGGLGGDDTLDLVLNDDPNVLHISKANDDPNDETAELTIGGGVISLDGIENIKIDARQGADQIEIDDLLDTSICTVDLQLGSDKAKMWQAHRDSDGNYQVYPDEYDAFAEDTSVRQSACFYRYDLAEGGQYVFEDDGSPRLETITVDAEIDEADVEKRVQRVWLADGLNRVNLFYGGREVEISAETMAEGVEAAIEETLLDGQIDVDVTGSGTQADPWVVTFPESGCLSTVGLPPSSADSRGQDWRSGKTLVSISVSTA